MAKTRKNAVPKRIAGMKVPKSLRRGKVGRLLSSPVGQALIIETVARGGEQLMAREARLASVERPGGARSQAAAPEFSESAAESSAAFVYALRQAARAFVAAMQEQQVAARAEGARESPKAGRDEEKPEKKEPGERSDRRTAH